MQMRVWGKSDRLLPALTLLCDPDDDGRWSVTVWGTCLPGDNPAEASLIGRTCIAVPSPSDRAKLRQLLDELDAQRRVSAEGGEADEDR